MCGISKSHNGVCRAAFGSAIKTTILLYNAVKVRLSKRKAVFYFESINRMFIVGQSPIHLLDLRADSPTVAQSSVCNGEHSISPAASDNAPQGRIFRIFWIYQSQKNSEMPSNKNVQGNSSKLICPKNRLLSYNIYTPSMLA